jgi:hypothetical protein
MSLVKAQDLVVIVFLRARTPRSKERWDEILQEPEQPEIFPIARAMRHHIRAVAYAAKGETAKAREEQKLFRERRRSEEERDLRQQQGHQPFCRRRRHTRGRDPILVREGKMVAGIKALWSAVAKEGKLRYSELPDWVVPVRHACLARLTRVISLPDWL